MADERAHPAPLQTVRASVDLIHQVIEGKDYFALPTMAGVSGPCNGKMDGDSCGEGCTCRGGQPWYDPEGIVKLGFQLNAQPGRPSL
jgi:hypothetical protein